MTWRQSWGENRAYYHDANGRLCSFPARFTSMAPVDPFVVVGRKKSRTPRCISPGMQHP